MGTAGAQFLGLGAPQGRCSIRPGASQAYRTQNVYFDSLAKWDLDKWETFMQAEFKEHAPMVAEYRTERRVVFDVLFAADMAMQRSVEMGQAQGLLAS